MLEPSGLRVFIHRRQQQDVSVIRNARATEVSVTEAVDHRIGIMITGATVPTREPCIRTELDHAERHRRAGKRVAMSACTDEGIDVAREVALCGGVGREYQQYPDKDSSFFDRIY